jgi:hypothetical protein
MELDARRGSPRQGRVMATVTHVFTIEYAAKLLGEDPELLEAIISNDDNLTYGTIIHVCTGTDESFNTLTEDGIDELRDMLKDARRSEDAWNNFLEDFVEHTDVIARVKSRGPR